MRKIRTRLDGEIKPVSVEHSRTYEDNEKLYAAKNAIDLDLETWSYTRAGSDGSSWLKLTLDQISCIRQIVRYFHNEPQPLNTWTCSYTDCSCDGSYCIRFTLTVSTEGVSPDNLPSVSDCKHGNRVKIEEVSGSDFRMHEIAIGKRINLQ